MKFTSPDYPYVLDISENKITFYAVVGLDFLVKAASYHFDSKSLVFNCSFGEAMQFMLRPEIQNWCSKEE